jgi:predicted nuclease with TOPRIM domain
MRIFAAKQPNAEDLRIAASNAEREETRQRDYVTELRGDIAASRANIVRLRAEADQLEESVNRRAERLKRAESELASYCSAAASARLEYVKAL